MPDRRRVADRLVTDADARIHLPGLVLGGEHAVDRPRCQRARRVQFGAQLGRDGEVGGRQVRVQLADTARADDGRPDARLGGHPVQRDLGHRAVHCGGDLAEHVEHTTVVVVPRPDELRCHVEPAGAGGTVGAALILAGEQATGQWAPRGDAEAERRGHRHVLGLDLPVQQRVRELEADHRTQRVCLGVGLRAGRVPARHVGQARVADLARRHQVVQGVHDFLDRREPVPGVQQVQVDVVGAQPPQRRIQRADEVFAAVAARVRVTGVDAVGELGGEYDSFADPRLGDQLAKDGLAVARRVEVRGVHEVAARFQAGPNWQMSRRDWTRTPTSTRRCARGASPLPTTCARGAACPTPWCTRCARASRR